MMKTREEIAKMTVKELGAALKELGAASTGKKEELVERYFLLLQAEQPEAAVGTAEAAEVAEADPPAANPKEPAAAPAAKDSVEEEAAVAPAVADLGKHSRITFDDVHIKQVGGLGCVLSTLPLLTVQAV